jgi:hypothetical protein
MMPMNPGTVLSPGFDGETKIKTKFETKGRFMGSVQFHWHCIMPMNLTFRAADCKSALRGRFMGSVHGIAPVHNVHEPRVLAADCKSALRGGSWEASSSIGTA